MGKVKKAQFQVGEHKIWLSWDSMVGLYHCIEEVLESGDYFEEEEEEGEKYDIIKERERIIKAMSKNYKEKEEVHGVDWNEEDRKREDYDMYQAIRDTVCDKSVDREEMIGKIENVCGGMSKEFDKVMEGK